MPTAERRLRQLESVFLPRRRRNVSDPAELTNVELSVELLDNFEALSDPNLAEQRADICAKPWIVDGRLSDPMERFAVHLLRTVIWGGNCDWVTGPIDGALPVLAEQYRGRFPDRIFDAAMKPPPWSRAV
jgi:hypothetical protein